MRTKRTTARAFLFAAVLSAGSLVFFSDSAGAKKTEEAPRPADASLAVKIEAKFLADPEVSPFEIDVDVRDGVVRLSGAVETEAERKEAEDLARSVDGVKAVKNEIRLGDPTMGDLFSDAWIVSKVKAKLAADPEINPFRIDVDAVQGVVTLSGTVPSRAVRKEALEHAENTKGVRRVEDRLVLEPKKTS